MVVAVSANFSIVRHVGRGSHSPTVGPSKRTRLGGIRLGTTVVFNCASAVFSCTGYGR